MCRFLVESGKTSSFYVGTFFLKYKLELDLFLRRLTEFATGEGFRLLIASFHEGTPETDTIPLAWSKSSERVSEMPQFES